MNNQLQRASIPMGGQNLIIYEKTYPPNGLPNQSLVMQKLMRNFCVHQKKYYHLVANQSSFQMRISKPHPRYLSV